MNNEKTTLEEGQDYEVLIWGACLEYHEATGHFGTVSIRNKTLKLYPGATINYDGKGKSPSYGGILEVDHFTYEGEDESGTLQVITGVFSPNSWGQADRTALRKA